MDPFKKPYDRDGIIAWLTREGFQDFEGRGYFEKCYALSHSYPCLRVGVCEGQICATVSMSDGNLDDEHRRTVYIGECYSVPAISALWSVLTLFDYDEGRDRAFWDEFNRRLAARKEAVQ